MKMLVVADVHYSLPQLDWLVDTAPNYDLMIIAGDLLDTNSFVDPGAQIIVLLKYLGRLRQLTRVVVCSGNHDLDAAGVDGEKHAGWLAQLQKLAIPVDGESFEFGGLLVTVCPWWDGPRTQAAIAAQLETAAAKGGRPWLWVYHAPPPDSPVSWSGQRYFGDQSLGEWIARYSPDFVVSGHVHEAPFARGGSWVDRVGGTWLFNAGRQIGEVPTSIAIDTAAHEAAWFSLEGAESVRLDLPLSRPIPQLTAMPFWMDAPRAGNPT